LLEKYRDEGVPAHLGLGLYRADLYIPKLKALMPKDPPPSKPIKKATPLIAFILKKPARLIKNST